MEWRLIAPGSKTDAGETIRPMRADIETAIANLGRGAFELDSTIQLLKMMRALGFRRTLVDAVLPALENQFLKRGGHLGMGHRIVFSGHRVDAPNRPTPRFPPQNAGEVGEALRRQVEDIRGTVRDPVALLQGTSGGDILFAEACLDAGIPVAMRMPFDVERFVKESVEPSGGAWVERFHRLLERVVAQAPESLDGLEPLLRLEDVLGVDPGDSPLAATNEWMLAVGQVVLDGARPLGRNHTRIMPRAPRTTLRHARGRTRCEGICWNSQVDRRRRPWLPTSGWGKMVPGAGRGEGGKCREEPG